ncbi:MAG: glnR [Bacillales bacterium]|jgi:MerR family glutamine synthetase transcriptional repressor|nr:glnR [Bacillales bacterium]
MRFQSYSIEVQKRNEGNSMSGSSEPLFPMSTVMQQTDLTARKIRYYEDNNLLAPKRSNGNHRLYSFADIDRLLEIKKLLQKGYTMSVIKKYFADKEKQSQHKISDAEARKIFRDEFKQNFNQKGMH